ncbi:T9SS type A sorting domain-containing protein [Sungkyunkwania multivorans]|uniref:T9SS type A sorting domain-containing protein n=1 Tax=Sungkyunkwania multivorans TaxID=1173618 RepID=A0ABW3D0U3_9FLAO
MKQHYLLFFLIGIFSVTTTAQVSYDQLDKSDLETTILLKNVAPFSVLKADHDHYGMFSFQQSYKELSIADSQNRFEQLEAIVSASRLNTNNETVMIAGLHSAFETISNEAFSENRVIIDEAGNAIRTSEEPIFEKHQKTIIVPLTVNKRGLQTSFYFKSSFFVNTTDKQLSSISADFDNGQGFIDIRFDTPIDVHYVSKGKKELTFKLLFENGEEFSSSATLNISHSRHDTMQLFGRAPQDIISTGVADLSAYSGAVNFAGLGEYEIFLGADGVLDKPVLVIDGYDPGDTRTVADVYDLFSYTDSGGATQNLADIARNNGGFDLVILNLPQYLRLADNSLLNIDNVTDTNGDMIIDENDYPAGSVLVDGGADFMERNAMIFIELLNTINAQKVGTEENVIIGPSMGGLISRYALNYMENMTMDHDSRLWLSFDAPHLGSNLPIGFQHLFNYLAFGLDLGGLGGDQSIVILQPLIDSLIKSPASRQLLVDHLEAHLLAGSDVDFDPAKLLPEPHPYFITFFNAVNALTTSGFPENTRNISMINGSGLSAAFQDKMGVDIVPGREVLNTTIEDVGPSTDATLIARFTPSASQTLEVSDLFIDAPFLCFCDLRADADSESPAATDGVDAAPGGLFNMTALADSFGGTDPLITAFFDALQTDFFSFIPTTSGMALTNQPDWYATPNPNNGDTANETIFDAWYMPPTNEEHVLVTEDHANFALSEIAPSLLSNETFILDDLLIVENNPIKEQLVILSGKTFEQLSVNIYDVMGKEIQKNTIDDPAVRNIIPLNTASGIYLLKLTTEAGSTMKKIVVK